MQFPVRDPCIDLCRLKVFVPQKITHVLYRHAVFQQVRGYGVTQVVQAYVFLYLRLPYKLFYRVVEMIPLGSSSCIIRNQCRLFFGCETLIGYIIFNFPLNNLLQKINDPKDKINGTRFLLYHSLNIEWIKEATG